MPRGQNPDLDTYIDLIFPDDQLWKTVTWSFKTNEGEKAFANYAAQDRAGLYHLIETRAGRADTDVYVALSTQRVADMDKKSVDGYPRAVRQIKNVVSLNAIYLDIDVGKKDSYVTIDDAFAALDDFCDQMGMPDPTMEVLSGGGLHVYWCCDAPIPAASWGPLAGGLRDAALAYGLKFDPQVTVNSAGILRPPGTFNHKTFPPKRVQLMQHGSYPVYSYQQLVGALKPYIGNATVGVAAPQSVRNQNLQANVGVAAPVALDDVIRVCPVIADIEQRGGDGDAEPLWSQAILLASFLEDAHSAAHRLSSGDPRYTPAGTDQKLQDKVNARAQNPSLGWPKCAQFSPLHPACQSCALFAHGKSPLNFAQKPAPSVPLMPAGTDPLMPMGYWRDVDKHVFTTIISEKTKVPTVIDVLGKPILDAAIDVGNGNLVFRTIVAGIDKWGSANIHANLQPTPAAQAMAGQGVYIQPANYKHARDFLVAWMNHLQNIKQRIVPQSYGWTDDAKGFTYDETVYYPTGKDVAFRGSGRDMRFTARGDLKPWQDAMHLIYGNASLETVVASAFAAPLLDLISPTSVVVSVCSEKSGIGKTTALSLAQAVWGDPRTGMSSLADTLNSVMKKVADLRNLPIYWDELRTTEQIEKVIDLVFQITQGKAKSTLNRDRSQQSAPAFTTMFAIASNYGISDTVYSRTDGTEAGGLRVFEIEAMPRLHNMFQSQQAMLLQKKVESNYGRAGEVYAGFIAKNRSIIEKALELYIQQLNATHQFSDKERFWSLTMASLSIGAQIANRAGLTTFDIPGIEKCLMDTLTSMRATLANQAYSTLSHASASGDVLGTMISDIHGRHLLITDIINHGAGKPTMLNPTATGLPSQLSDVWAQLGEKDHRIRVRVKPFYEYLRKRKLQPGQVLKTLAHQYFIHRSKSAIGIGVPMMSGVSTFRTECIDFIPVPPNGPGSSRGSSSPTSPASS